MHLSYLSFCISIYRVNHLKGYICCMGLNMGLLGLGYRHQDESRAIAFLQNAWAGRAGTFESLVLAALENFKLGAMQGHVISLEIYKQRGKERDIFLAGNTCSTQSLPYATIPHEIYRVSSGPLHPIDASNTWLLSQPLWLEGAVL